MERARRIWIDLSNSPHALMFDPVARRLQELGHEVLVTVRDTGQTVELALARWPHAAVIGGDSPARPVAKAAVIGTRAYRLGRWLKDNRADLALSHNSYAQIVAARTARIPVVTAMDYEHQPINHVAFRLAHRILLPRALPGPLVRRQGAHPSKVRHYPGLKEELHLGEFRRSRSDLDALGITGDVLAVVRTPPTQATYHQFDNALFREVLTTVIRQENVCVVAFPRYPEQREWLASLNARNLVVPTRAVDAPSIMYHADLVLGAGGTMTREAAVMGVPAYTLFAGKQSAVDRWLIGRGALRLVTEPGAVADLRPRTGAPRTPAELRAGAAALCRAFVDLALQTPASSRRASH